MGWRPEGWEESTPIFYKDDSCLSAYEAGADAMLEGLKSRGVFTYGYHTPDIDLHDVPERSGYWCFIPDK